MRLVRASLAIVVFCVAGFTLFRVPWTRQSCNIEKRRAEQLIERAQTIVSDFERQDAASRAAERMDRCIAATPDDWQLYFLAGALHEIAGRAPVGMARYQAALALEERPEIYQAISFLQLQRGEAEEGLRNAEKATSFNLQFAESYQPLLRDQLWVKALERERLLKQKQK